MVMERIRSLHMSEMQGVPTFHNGREIWSRVNKHKLWGALMLKVPGLMWVKCGIALINERDETVLISLRAEWTLRLNKKSQLKLFACVWEQLENDSVIWRQKVKWRCISEVNTNSFKEVAHLMLSFPWSYMNEAYYCIVEVEGKTA